MKYNLEISLTVDGWKSVIDYMIGVFENDLDILDYLTITIVEEVKDV